MNAYELKLVLDYIRSDYEEFVQEFKEKYKEKWGYLPAEQEIQSYTSENFPSIFD